MTSRTLAGLFPAKMLVRRNLMDWNAVGYCTEWRVTTGLAAIAKPKFTDCGALWDAARLPPGPPAKATLARRRRSGALWRVRH